MAGLACGTLGSVLDGDVWRYLPLAPLPSLIVSIVGSILLLVASLSGGRASRRLAAALLVATAVSIIVVTLGGQNVGTGRSVNLQPGAGIRAELHNVNRALGVVNVLGNLILFIPLGWLVAVRALYPPRSRVTRGIVLGVVVGLALSASIEVSQYFLGRSADMDDVLLNTLGSALGALVGAQLSSVRRHRPEPENTSETTLTRT
jgi:glycopeptide antibiotics resistance protein